MNAVTIGPLAVALASSTGCSGTNPCPSTDTATQIAQAQSDAPIYVGRGDPYASGGLDIVTVDVATCEHQAPVPLRLFVPQDQYPVVLFLHGFMTRNSAYDEVLRHVASHGFLVVAPQMYEPGIAPLLGNPTAAAEAELAGKVAHWIPQQLRNAIGFEPRTDRIGIAGHSRGGKVAWLLVAADPQRFLAIAGVDPVDGTGGPWGNQARVVQGAFASEIPALVFGTELGGSCAPAGDNHVQFHAASQSPAWHVIAVNHGHADMLDEPDAKAASALCASGPDRAGMRRLTAGLLTGFFRAALQADATSYQYLSEQASTPIPILAEQK
jgi:chlorophyllase